MTWRSAAGLAAFIAVLQTVTAMQAAGQHDVKLRIGQDVSAAIARCFKGPSGLSPPYPAVTLVLNFRPDGNLDGPPQLGDPPGGDARHSATTAAVLAAASECARIDNAARFRDTYSDWASLRLIIRPGEP
ncbi:hypothetical protein ABID16_001130 [Rhizobium aquaticum]|uniref:TolA protein n=1 Tax=Rhizobium aquaticum TaxID=1549636 RepID=A0ABV2IWF6_9HYPH